ncbi:MAG: hypothetical protein ACREBG_11050 [Pyrinomonadaceae bacterium]
MEIDKSKIQTQDDMDEPALMDQVEGRVEAEMKVIEGKAKEQVAHGLQDKKLEREAKQLKKEGERDLEAASKAENEKQNS